jgi:ABC-type transporter Mla maintaining outer membrane lipid asymmetry ATPase subunit MlaF
MKLSSLKPEIILYDEPTAGLNTLTSEISELWKSKEKIKHLLS